MGLSWGGEEGPRGLNEGFLRGWRELVYRGGVRKGAIIRVFFGLGWGYYKIMIFI